MSACTCTSGCAMCVPVMRATATETRVTDPTTGGQKGSKLARFDMIPWDVMHALAEHHGKGEAKYPSDESGQANWRRGYRWSLSFAALQRHLTAWWTGEDHDPETGSLHLVAVIWHACALTWFVLHNRGTDDRPNTDAPSPALRAAANRYNAQRVQADGGNQ